MHGLLAAVLRASVLGACVVMLPFVSLPEAWAEKDSDKGKGADKVIVINTTANPVPVVIQGGGAGPQRESVEIVTDVSTPSLVNVYTVPAGKQLTITDVIISFDSQGTVSIYRNSTAVSRVVLNISTYEHSYVSGIVFTESQTVSIGNQSGNILNLAHTELRGLLE